MKVTFGASTWIWSSPFTTASVELFARIADMGFDFVEIPLVDPDLLDIPTVKDALDRSGLSVTLCGVFGPDRDLTS